MRRKRIAQGERTTMGDKIYVLPETCGPLLREYYSKLLQEPIPRQLRDLLAMLEEAAAQAEADKEAGADVRDQSVPQEAQREPAPDKSK
jgi:hypothetical protein